MTPAAEGPSFPSQPAIRSATEALTKLSTTNPELADTLARLVVAVAGEACRTSRFASVLSAAVTGGDVVKPRRTGRRAAGVIDPFAIYVESGESGLRDRLRRLDVEQLRDIVAEHGMDHDRLAMKWKDPDRVIDRIVEKVRARASKGSAFRPDTSDG
jgi:hypothetical protein